MTQQLQFLNKGGLAVEDLQRVVVGGVNPKSGLSGSNAWSTGMVSSMVELSGSAFTNVTRFLKIHDRKLGYQ